MQKIDFVNSQQPAINDTNLNLMQTYIETAIQGAVSGDTLPIGTIMPFSGYVPPDNYLLCNGDAVSRTTYAQLFSIVGTKFGVGDGSTTFNLPDLRGKVPVGYDVNQTEFQLMGVTGGEKTVTLTVNQIPSHYHTQSLVGGSGGNPGNKAAFSWSQPTNQYDYSGTDLAQRTGGGQAHNNLQPYQTVNYIIKAFQTAGVVAQVVNQQSSGSTNVYSIDYINKMLSSWTMYNYSGSVMSSNNGSVQTYSSVNVFVNGTGTLAYMTGTLYNNHSTAGEASVTFNSILRPATSKITSNIIALYNNSVIGENANISTDGKITMTLYGSANGNSRHTFIGVLIPLK